MHHARDWYIPPKSDRSPGDIPRSYRANICQIPDYKFMGGTIDKNSLAAIDCPKCLVMIDGFLASEDLKVVPNIAPIAGHRGAHTGRALVHGRNST